MIIVKTKNGDRFINDKAVTMVVHDREKAKVYAYGDNILFPSIEDVEGIIYTNDAQPTSWKDEGSEVQRLLAELEKKKKEYSQLCEHFGYVRDWCMTYKSAIILIKDRAKRAERGNKDAIVNLLDIIESAEKEQNDSEEKFKEARKKWEER